MLMNKSTIKVMKLLAMGIGGIVVLLIAFIVFLKLIGTPTIPQDAILVTDNRYQNYSCVETLRELTMIPDFPPFDSEVYEYTNENGDKEIYMRCVFNPTLPEDSVWKLHGKFRYDMIDQDSNGGTTFLRGWSKKKFMPIPNNMDEDMKVEISMFCGDNDFCVSYKKNPSVSGVDRDSLNNYLGVTLPEFTIVNYISPDVTTLQFKKPISKATYKALEKNEWCEHKFEDDGTSMCWIWKKEPGEYSTYVTLDDQLHTAYLRRYKNDN